MYHVLTSRELYPECVGEKTKCLKCNVEVIVKTYDRHLKVICNPCITEMRERYENLSKPS